MLLLRNFFSSLLHPGYIPMWAAAYTSCAAPVKAGYIIPVLGSQNPHWGPSGAAVSVRLGWEEVL